MEEQTNALDNAVCAVMADVKRLEKAHENAFARYNFTSVDDFKDSIRGVMAEHGLSLHIDQTGMELREVEGDKNKKSIIAEFELAVTLKHSSGVKDEPEHMSVLLPFTGAQTSGAARSYAIKEWIKGRFLASSGDVEAEADLHEQDNFNAMRLSKTEARDLHRTLTDEMRDAVDSNNPDELAQWWKENRHKIVTLPKDWHVTMQNDYADEWKRLKANERLDSMSEAELDALAEQGGRVQ